MYSPYIHVYPVCGYVRVYVCQNLYTYIIYIYTYIQVACIYVYLNVQDITYIHVL